MLGAMLKQLASRGGIPEHIRDAFRKSIEEFGDLALRLPVLVEIMKKSIAARARVFVYIDTLDESTPKHRRELLESI